MKIYIPIGKHLLGIFINFRYSFKKREGNNVVAISNKVDHRYCIFLDYDLTEETTVRKDIRGLQKAYELGNGYIFKTLNGFHVIFLDLVTYKELQTIINASSCDEHYKYVSTKNNNRQWVLRFTPKKNGNTVTYYDMEQAYHTRELSYPHANYLVAQGVPVNTFKELEPFLSCREEELVLVGYKA